MNKEDSALDFVRLRALKRIVAAGGEFWCVMAHKQISTPVCGHYRCLRCNRVYPVLWQQPDPVLWRRISLVPQRTAGQGVSEKAAWLAGII
jgi:hypothetical protein